MMTERSDRVTLVVEDCVEYWRRTGVPRSAVAGMREELEQHLQDAVAAGKTVESVVGPDVLAFAEEWAREFRPAGAVPRPANGVGPGFLTLGAGILTLMSLLAIGAYAGSGTTIEVCCPPQVFETGRPVAIGGEMLIWLILVFAVGVASIAGAFFLFRGRLRLGGGIALTCAPLALLTPVHVVAMALLAAAGAWAFARARRAETPVPAP
jgi:hypothetical protein